MHVGAAVSAGHRRSIRRRGITSRAMLVLEPDADCLSMQRQALRLRERHHRRRQMLQALARQKLEGRPLQEIVHR